MPTETETLKARLQDAEKTLAKLNRELAAAKRAGRVATIARTLDATQAQAEKLADALRPLDDEAFAYSLKIVAGRLGQLKAKAGGQPPAKPVNDDLARSVANLLAPYLNLPEQSR
jgi:chromosome segregation ATPase